MEKFDLKEIGWVVMDWIHMAQERNKGRAIANVKCAEESSGSQKDG